MTRNSFESFSRETETQPVVTETVAVDDLQKDLPNLREGVEKRIAELEKDAHLINLMIEHDKKKYEEAEKAFSAKRSWDDLETLTETGERIVKGYEELSKIRKKQAIEEERPRVFLEERKLERKYETK